MSVDRHTSTTGTWRVARGAVVGLCASGFAAAGHALADGALPDLGTWAALTTLAMGLSVLASRWRWRVTGLSGVLLGTQLGFHAAFTALAEPTAHHHGAATEGMAAVPDPRMLGAHLLAALAVGLLLSFGENGLRRALDALDILVLRSIRPLDAGRFALPDVLQVPVVVDGATLVSHDPGRVRRSRGPPR